jgi:hypothetical protein
LDYKKVISRDLTKHFAAMSNQRGGLIRIGVEEDPTTGLLTPTIVAHKEGPAAVARYWRTDERGR